MSSLCCSDFGKPDFCPLGFDSFVFRFSILFFSLGGFLGCLMGFFVVLGVSRFFRRLRFS